MTLFRALFLALVALSALSGCAYRYNYPLTDRFPISDKPDRIGVYVDANGTFYPDKWRDVCPARCEPFKKDPSLLLKASRDNHEALVFLQTIAREEKRQLGLIADFVGTHARLFILIHGFNVNESEAKDSYDRIVERLALTPSDGVIEFYWDGFVTKPPKPKFTIAPATFWARATAQSQTAGSRGLRRILALASNRDIVLVSHSRGASVMLSALSNPPYADGFLTRTERYDFNPDDGVDGSPNFLRPPPLPANSGNRLHLVMLAPAIGCIDFRRPDFRHRRAREMSQEGCASVRPLPSEVKSFDYTVNSGDSVLGKYILPSSWYNATDFGYAETLGKILKTTQNWGFMTAHKVTQEHGHDFNCYIADPEFADMLRAAGAEVSPAPPRPPDKPCSKGKPAQPRP